VIQSLKDYVWVFVGCGGTFYAASPYLAVLRRRYAGGGTILIDPDDLKKDDHDRQWPAYCAGFKVEAAANALDCDMATQMVGSFNSSDRVLEGPTDGQPVLAIVNVDNDQARLAVADWLASRVSPGIMVVSGCERLFGQCYPGVWMDGEAVHDWRDCHPDVGTESGSMHRCNLQDIRANALTGVCVGMCIEDIARRVENQEWGHLREFYWHIDEKREALPGPGVINMWDIVVQHMGESNYGADMA
jgi:hypothetical protein